MKGLRSIFLLALPYVVTVLLPVISVFCLGNILINSYHERIIADKQKSIEIAFERYLQRIESIETLSYMIGQNGVMSDYNLINYSYQKHTLLDCMEVRDMLKDSLINNDVSEIYFYDAQNERIITSKAVYSKASDYYEYAYQLPGYTVHECVERLENSEWGYGYNAALEARIDKRQTTVVEYRLSIPFNIVRRSPSQLVLVMETEELFCDFYDVLDENSEFYVYDEDENLIFADGEKYETLLDIAAASTLQKLGTEEEKIYGMVLRAEDQSWTVKLFLPKLLQADNNNIHILYIWMLIVLTIVGSLALCMYFTYKNHREIMDILMMFKGKSAGEELQREKIGYQAIREYADVIMTENARFQERIGRYESSRKYEILDTLVRNTYGNIGETDTEFAGGELQIRTSASCVVLCICYENAHYKKDTDMSVKDYVKKLLPEIVDRKIEIFDTSARENISVLPIEDEENADVMLGDIVARLHAEIVSAYGIRLTIGVGDVVASIYDISTSYAQAQAVIKFNETSGSSIFLYSELEKKKDNIQDHTILKILNYVNENYCDSGLSLKQISNVFGLREDYISKLFKTRVSENLSEVIEKLRIEKSCDLLKNTNKKISEIADAVGYTSDASFRRAFKKVTGVSPGEYRMVRSTNITKSEEYAKL